MDEEPGKSVLWRSTVLPEALLIVCTIVMIWFFRRLLVDAKQTSVDLPTLLPLFGAMLGLAVTAGALVLSQASRSAKRLNGPCQRLIHAMQRTRSGDIAHRVHLRQGDGLKDVAAEFNKLLDWLNANPPSGVKTGTDLIEVDRSGDPSEYIGLEMSSDQSKAAAEEGR